MGLVLALPRSPLPSLVREGPKVYRQRRPERAVLYRLFEGSFEEYLKVYLHFRREIELALAHAE